MHRTDGGPIPLTVSAVGHRALIPEDTPKIREDVLAFFASLEKKYHNGDWLCAELAGPLALPSL